MNISEAIDRLEDILTYSSSRMLIDSRDGIGMLFSMTHDVDRLTTSAVEFLSLAQFRQDPDLLWLAIRRMTGENPDDTFRKVVETESKYGISSTWSFQRKLMSEDIVAHLTDNKCEIALHAVSSEDLRLRTETESEYGIKIEGFRTHYHRLGRDILRLAQELGYSYDSSLYGGTSPIRLPGGLLEIPVTFEDGYLVHLYRLKNAKKLIERTVEQYLNDEAATFVFNFHQNTLARRREWSLFLHILDLAQEYGIQFKTCTEISRLASNWG